MHPTPPSHEGLNGPSRDALLTLFSVVLFTLIRDALFTWFRAVVAHTVTYIRYPDSGSVNGCVRFRTWFQILSSGDNFVYPGSQLRAGTLKVRESAKLCRGEWQRAPLEGHARTEELSMLELAWILL